MVLSPDKVTVQSNPDIEGDRVAAYLARHPDFLSGHPELIRLLTPPSRDTGSGVLDMQTFIISRLRDEIAGLEAQQAALVAAGRGNRSRQAEVHAAVIAMLGATTLEHLIDVVTGDFLQILHVDIALICVEGDGGTRRRCHGSGVHCIAPGLIDTLLGPGQNVRVGSDFAGDVRIFGGAAGLADSTAFARLALGDAPPSMLALGSRRADRFEAGRGSEQLGFLARVLEHSLRAWFELRR